MDNVFDFLNNGLGITASILTLLGLGGSSYAVHNIIKKKKNKKCFSDNENIIQSKGDSNNLNNGQISGRENAINVIGNHNTIINPSSETNRTDTDNDYKSRVQILFIDDQEVPVIKNLRKAGWLNLKKIGDKLNLDIADIKNANIIFVDINGIGKELGCHNEGVGYAAQIKRKYPNKGIVIYSATDIHKIDEDLYTLDGWIPKGAGTIRFSNKIEELSEKYGY